MLRHEEAAIERQAQKVNQAYALHNGLSAEYEREFDILRVMRMKAMANKFRRERGLPPNAKTPYDE